MAAVNLVTATTIARVPLYRGQPSTSYTTGYTVPALTNARIASILLCNTTGVAATVTVSVVPSGGSPGVTNQILSALSVAGNTSTVVETPIHMDAGDFISSLQGTAAALTVSISGETYA